MPTESKTQPPEDSGGSRWRSKGMAAPYSPILTLTNILWLLAAMAFVAAPHMARLPWWFTTACLIIGSWRWWIARRGLRIPPVWVMATFALVMLAAARLEYGRFFGREVGVTLLIVMVFLKVLEMKSRRDSLLVIFLGFFLALTNFLYSQTILMGLYTFGCVWLLVATLVGFNRFGTEATIKERLIPAAWLVLQAIPMMLVLFFLFPRISGPLWSLPQDGQSQSGLSDNMSPGDISKLSLSDAVAFRVEFDGAVPATEDLYWRGPVLSEQFGRTWRMAATREITSLDFEAEGQPVRYRVTLQPSNQPWLFALDLPTVAPNGAFFLDDFQMRSRTPVTALKAYEVSSQLRYKIETNMSERKQARYMRYDTNLNPRTIAFGKQLRQDNPDPKAMVEALLKIYNTQFDYTLEPPALGENSVDEFFFDTKKGFCEHYASSFVLILRAAGVPARVVTGYQGGEVNPITRQLIVRQSEAHAWAEVWFPDLGWVRVDPTFAVSPLRINRGITAALGPVGVFNTFMEADQLGFLRQMRYSWDAVNSQWNQWVIGFSADRQRSMMENLFGLSQVDWRQLVWWLIGGMAFAAASVGSLLMVRAYQTRKAPVLIAYERLCAKLAKAGFTRAPHEGPRDLLARIAQHRPDLAAKAAPLLEAYIALRYAPPDDTASVGAFARSVRRFKPG